jgi:hypothetical protein
MQTKYRCQSIGFQSLYIHYKITHECPSIPISSIADHGATTLRIYSTASLVSEATRVFAKTSMLPSKAQTLVTEPLLSKNTDVNYPRQAGKRASMICPAFYILESSHRRLHLFMRETHPMNAFVQRNSSKTYPRYVTTLAYMIIHHRV